MRAAGILSDPKTLLYMNALATRPDDKRLAQSLDYSTQLAAFRQEIRKQLFFVPDLMRGNFMLGEHPGGKALVPFLDRSAARSTPAGCSRRWPNGSAAAPTTCRSRSSMPAC